MSTCVPLLCTTVLYRESSGHLEQRGVPSPDKVVDAGEECRHVLGARPTFRQRDGVARLPASLSCPGLHLPQYSTHVDLLSSPRHRIFIWVTRTSPWWVEFLLKDAQQHPNSSQGPASDLPTGRVLASISEAVALGVVAEEPNTVGLFRFSHPLMREVIYEGLPISARMQVHQRVGGSDRAPARSGIDPTPG